MHYSYRVLYRHPHTGVDGLAVLFSEDEIAEETARLESQGYVVTKVMRRIGIPAAHSSVYRSGSASPHAMEDIDVWRSADQLMKMHGADAAFVASNLADARLADGNGEGFQVWLRVVRAINELSREKPGANEPMN
jgi:hypothetical protein